MLQAHHQRCVLAGLEPKPAASGANKFLLFFYFFSSFSFSLH